MSCSPTTLEALREAVLSAPRVLCVGAETKPRLSALEALKISTRGLRGITEYDPGEFTISALAGTPVREIIDALSAEGQCLPFDPMLVEAGSTLGGLVASGLGGPGSFRYGGVRDFILGVRFVDGLGRLLRLGGKVVKNAAGFDVPKFLVGSLGRFGAIGEVTFKVFPKPEAILTLTKPYHPDEVARIARGRFEADAIDVPPGGRMMLVRLAGRGKAIEALAAEIGGDSVDDTIWDSIRETPWAFKSALVPGEAAAFRSSHLTRGGEVAFSLEVPPHGLALRGEGPLWVGGRTRYEIEGRVKEALDPDHRFPSLDD